MENMIASTTLLALFLCLRRFFDGKISARLQYGIWLLVAVRLLFVWCPLPESSLSLMNLFSWVQEASDIQNEDLQENTLHESSQQGDGDLTEMENSIGSAAKKDRGEGDDQYAVAQGDGNATGKENGVVQEKGQTLDKNDGAQQEKGGAAALDSMAARGIGTMNILRGVYGMGAGILFFWMVIENVRFWLGLRRRRILCHEKLPMSWMPGKLYILEGLNPPFLFGRNIYVSPDMLGDEQKLCHILTHETCHWRQGDILWSFLRNACLVMYWFHPLVWYGAWLSRTDGELSCDERAIRMLGEDSRISYGETLLQLIRQKNARGNFSCMSTLMSGNKRETRKRIDRIARGQRDVRRRVFILGACIFAMLAVTVPGRGHSPGEGGSAERNLAGKEKKEESTDGGGSKESFSGTEEPEDAVENGKERVLEARSSQYEIYVQEGELQRLYVYNRLTEQTYSIMAEPAVELQIISRIMSLEWLAPGKAAVFSHVSPSTGCLSIYELDTKELLFERYCSFYAWHDSLESLVYVETPHHFSGEYGEYIIKDHKDRIVYQTGKKETVSEIAINSKGDLAIVTEKNSVKDDHPVNQILYIKKSGKKYGLAGRKEIKKRKQISQLKWLDDGRIGFKLHANSQKWQSVKVDGMW